MTSYCKVRWCRFSSTHVTKGHKCGTCGQYGHGETECYSTHQKQFLADTYHDDVLPNNLHCTVEDCNNKQYHTADAHHCPRCQVRDTHTLTNCDTNTSSQSISTNGMNIASIMTTISSSAASSNIINKSYSVKCPLCREDNYIHKPVKLYGISDKCCICMENVVDVLMPSCGHCCICLTCLPTLDKY